MGVEELFVAAASDALAGSMISMGAGDIAMGALATDGFFGAAAGLGADALGGGRLDYGAGMDAFGNTVGSDSANLLSDLVSTGTEGGLSTNMAGDLAKTGFDWGSVKSAASLASNGMSIYSGLKGMDQAEQMRKLAAANAAKADSWGTSGGRALSDQQLQAFLKDPSQAAAQDPAYALRIQGAQRANAIHGADSGAMSVAGANASTGWYDQRLQQLSGLAGASGTGSAGAQIGIQGQEYANSLESKGLASLGYGVTRMGASQNQLPDNVMMFLQKMGYMQ